MITPEFTISVSDSQLQVQFDRLPAELRDALRPHIVALTHELLAAVKAGEPRRTGRLQSLTGSFVDEGENWVRGRVRVLGPGRGGPNIAAAALEYGAHRSFPVRGYQRRGVAVSGYQRRQNITARRFLHGPADAMRAHILSELQAAIETFVSS